MAVYYSLCDSLMSIKLMLVATQLQQALLLLNNRTLDVWTSFIAYGFNFAFILMIICIMTYLQTSFLQPTDLVR